MSKTATVWDSKPLSELVHPSRQVTYGIVQPGDFDENGILLIRGQDYIKGWATLEDFFRVNRQLHESYHRSVTRGGDVLMCIVGATTGAVNVVPDWIEEANITQTTARISCDGREADANYVAYVLQSEIGQKQVRKYIKGSAQPGLNLADVERFYVPHPDPPEQRKIARILTTLDNLIEKTEALIAKYQSIKQGMMHDLFTRGVDESGRLRPTHEQAPDLYKQSELGWIPKEWEVVLFDDFIAHFDSGWSPICDPTPAKAGECGSLKTTSISWEGYDPTENKRLPEHLTPKPRTFVEQDDILITRVGPRNRIGVVAHVHDTRELLMVSDNMLRLRLRGQ